MKIKVCGITSAEQFHQLALMDIDYAGFIFYRGSPRYVANRIAPLELGGDCVKTKKVGVFVNEAADLIIETIEKYSLALVQLHGDEQPGLCKQVSQYATIIKAFRISDENEQDIAAITQPYAEHCDYFLFDAGCKNAFGGTGLHFNWDALLQAELDKPFFLGGGIGLSDIKKLNAFDHPYLHAADINSRFETSPGCKDMNRVSQFAKTIKHRLHDSN